MATPLDLQAAMFDGVRKMDNSAEWAFHDEYIFWNAIEGQGHNHGRATAKAWRTAFEDAVIEIRHRYQPRPDVAISEFTVTATWTGPFGGLKPNGRRFVAHGMIVHEMRDGKLFRGREYYDSLPIFQQLGIIEATVPVVGEPQGADLPAPTLP